MSINNMLDDSQLSEVSGGAGKGRTKHLPFHACKDGRKGELISLGLDIDDQIRLRGSYKCSLCGKEGTVYFLPGTTNLCDLI